MRSHHDVLGIRPNAGREEIELAFKGRRSQYHPDRYAQADQETQAWATACMQELNVAYEALISGRPSNAQAAAPESNTSDQPVASTPTTLKQALHAHPISRMTMARIYIAPDIPLKKLHNAIDSYGSYLKPNDVLALLDDTIFSSGKDGLLVTEKHLWVKEAFNSPVMYGIDGIALALQGDVLFVNGRKAREFNITERSEVNTFVMALSQVLKQRTSADRAAQSSPSAAPWKQGCQLEPLFLTLIEQFDAQRRQADPSTRSGRKLINMMHLMGVMLAMTDRLQAASEAVRGAPASSKENAWFRSDVVRLELVLYQAAWISYTLQQRLGRSEDQVEHDMELIMMYVVCPAVATTAGQVDIHDEDDFAQLIASPAIQMAKHRMQRYYEQMDGWVSQQANHLFEGLCNPVAFEVDGPETEHRALWVQLAGSATGFQSTERWMQEVHQILRQGLDEGFG